MLFLTSAVDYDALNARLNARSGSCYDDEVDLFSPCDGLEAPLSLGRMFVGLSWFGWFSLVTLLTLWTFRVASFARRIRPMWEIGEFFEAELQISARQLQTMQWNEVVRRIIDAQVRLKLADVAGSFDEL